MKDFGVEDTAATLGLALYVLACMPNYFHQFAVLILSLDGIGPMLFSPLSE